MIIKWSSYFVAGMILGASAGLLGCDRKEEVLDVKTPNRHVEVKKDKDTGEVEVQTEKRNKVDVDTPIGDVKVDVEKKD